jgi:DNA polymerase-3 subunit beta
MLTGIRVEIEGDTITLAATDRYRLAVKEFTWNPNDPKISTAALVPARTLSEGAKGFLNSSEVLIALASDNDRLMGFEGEGRRTTTRLLDAEFPKYRSLLPSESSSTADVSTQELLDALKRVELVAERNTPIRLDFKKNELVLRAGAGEEATAEEVIGLNLEGEGLEIAFNAAYLKDGLASVNAPTTRLSFTAASKPAVLSGVNSDGVNDETYRYLIMPVRLAG